MTDIAALKDLTIAADTAELVLRQWCADEASSLRQKVTAAKDALSRLTAPPPDEIAEIIKGIDAIETDDPRCGAALENASEALRALAQEIERLKGDAAGERQFNDAMRDQNVRFAKRICELEAERDQFAEQAAARDNRDRDMQEIMRINNELVAERDAIRRKTIEDAKRAIVGARFGAPSNWGGDRPRGWHLGRPCAPEEAAMHDNGCNDAFMAVSALAHSESKGKEESKE